MSENNNDKNIDEAMKANPEFVSLLEAHLAKKQPTIETERAKQIIYDFYKKNPNMIKMLPEAIKNNLSPITKDRHTDGVLTPQEREDIIKNIPIPSWNILSEIISKNTQFFPSDSSASSHYDAFADITEKEFARLVKAAEGKAIAPENNVSPEPNPKLSAAELKILIKDAARTEHFQPFSDLFKQFDALDAKKAESSVTPTVEPKEKIHISVPDRTKKLFIEAEKNKGNKPK